MTANKECSAKYDPETLPDFLPIYYKRLFPYWPYYRWLNYGGVPKTYFTQREFSFTLKDDIYIRYQSFSDQQELEKEMQKRCPYKIDIGAVYTHRPKDHKTVKAAAFQAKEKELVFDIDMTDYDDVRSCCQGADICHLCWPLMTIAIKIIDRSLRDDFGFEHLLWVYSGRRGVHCWVCDEAARKLSQNARSAIAEYLSVVKGGENQTKKVVLHDSVHPSIKLALDIVESHFQDYAVKKQKFLDTDEKCLKVLALIPDETTRTMLEEVLLNDDNAKGVATRWKAIKEAIGDLRGKSEKRNCHSCVEEIMLQYAYPRLDVNVSKGVNHLLKSPFCIHPKTGRVCVPIDVKNIDKFDPLAVPTISQLVDELNKTENKTEGEQDQGKKGKDYRRTSMHQPVQVFEAFVQNLEASWKGKLIHESDMKKDF
ncbi:DNA primase small subunit-like [Lineus longissimus]|uniref:DNA primase small subunit-like n=1 Tax=Lineus longissimus TaxID=88925 RepID=UPI002B4E78E1